MDGRRLNRKIDDIITNSVYISVDRKIIVILLARLRIEISSIVNIEIHMTLYRGIHKPPPAYITSEVKRIVNELK